MRTLARRPELIYATLISGDVGSGDVDLDGIALDSHRQRLDVAGDRGSQALAGFGREASAMQRTFDDVAVEPAVAEIGMRVGADVMGGVDLAIDVVQCNVQLSGFHGDHAADIHGVASGDSDPLF